MAALTRLLSPSVNKPYRTRDLDHTEPPFLNNQGLLAFKPHDVENPQNWSTLRRIAVTICAMMLVMNATFASSAPSGCIPSIAKEFGISKEAAALTITLFLLGYCAGPLLFAPLSELYGRRWIFYISFTLYIAFNFLCAFAPNFGSLLVGRFLTGTLVSAPLSNSPGVLADIWSPLERANAMALFSTMVWIGPALGPVVAGFLELEKDWHWVFYVLIWLGAGTWLILLTIPETHAPTILLHKAKRIRKTKVPGYEIVKAPVEMQDRSIKSVFGVALTRPWIILLDPISLLCAIYLAVVYMLLYMLFSIYPIVFQERRGWNSGVGELPLTGTVVGAVLGGAIVLYDTRRRIKKTERGEVKEEDMEPEDRLPLAMVGGIGFAASMFWFAWTAEFTSVHWIVPTISGGLLSTFMVLIFVAYLNYLVDVYLMYAASAIAANTIARSACGAVAPLFTSQMFHALGVGGGGSLVAGVATLLAVVPFVFYKYGKPIRIRSRFAPTNTKDKRRVEDEEANSTGIAVQS
ncbi:Efflux pump FUBT [Metarhizium anisopliae]